MKYDMEKLKKAEQALRILSVIFSILTVAMMAATGIGMGMASGSPDFAFDLSKYWDMRSFVSMILVFGMSASFFAAIFTSATEAGSLSNDDEPSTQEPWTPSYLARRLIQKSIMPLMGLAMGIVTLAMFSNPVSAGLAIGLLVVVGLHIAISLAHLYVEKQLHDPNSHARNPAPDTSKLAGKGCGLSHLFGNFKEFCVRYTTPAPTGGSINQADMKKTKKDWYQYGA